MSRHGDCPAAGDLHRFVLGQTSEAEAEHLERHLATCKDCLAALQGMRLQDTLVEALRGRRKANEPENVAVAALIARLAARPPQALPEDTPEATASFGESPAPEEATRALDARAAQDSECNRELFECLAPPQGEGEIGRLGPYRILRLLGSGGMGVVFQAEDTQLQRQVALKTLLPSLAARAASRQRFLREARAAAAIEHEHVIPIYQVGEDNGLPYLAMPFLKGEPLDERIRREGRLAVSEVLRIGREIADGLAAAHERGVIHRDVKPANVWLEARPSSPSSAASVVRGERGRVKILDFGLARAADDVQLTQQGMIVGTPAFMAPEQVNAQAVDSRADLFSLGCVLYLMATGRQPFQRGETLATLVAVGMEDPKNPLSWRPDLPPALDELILRLLAKAPANRPPSADAVVEALSAIEADGTQALRLQPPAAPAKRSSGKGRRRLLLGAAAALLLAVLVAAAAAVFRLATDQGEIEIVADDPDVEVVIRQGGNVVDIVDLKSRRKVVLRSGEYTLGLAGDPPGLRIDTTDPFELRRGDKKIVQVRRLPVVKSEVLHRIAWLDAEQGFPANIYHTGVSGDGRLFFGAGDAGPTGTIRIFEVATGRQVQRLRPGKAAWYSFAAFVPGGQYLAAAYKDDKDLYLWDLGTGKVVRKFTGHTDLGVALAVAPEGRRLLSWSDDRTLRLWEVETGKELRRLEGHAARAEGVFSPDGKKVLTFSPDRTLRLWDVETGKQLLKLEGHQDACFGSFSPDGKQALSCSADRTIRLWDLETGREVRRFDGPRRIDGSCGFVAGGRRAVAFCEDRTFRVWETATGKLLQAIDLTEMGGDCWSMTASPDGRLGLVNHADDSVRVLDLATGKEIHSYQSCRKARSFSFTPDGRIAVAGSFRAGMYVFRLPGKQGKR